MLPLLDELAGGLSVASTPTLSRLGPGLVVWSGVLLTLPMLSSFLEAPILAWTDRARGARRFVVAGGLVAMAASVALVSWSHGIVGIALAMLLYGPASGLSLGTAESMLVDGADEAVAARRLARWTLFASIGDVLAPAIVGLATDWRFAFRAVALAILGAALMQLRPTSAKAPPEREAAPEAAERDVAREVEDEPVWRSLRAALENRVLAAWLFGAAMCTLLDESLAVLVSLWTSGFGPHAAASALVAFSLGSVVGAAVLERALERVPTRRAVLLASIACIIALGAWVMATSITQVLVLGFLVGAAAGPLHPLAKAAAFATMPDRPGLVNGAAQAFVVVDILAPLALAWLATAIGPRATLATMALQPLALVVIALATPSSSDAHPAARADHDREDP